MRRFLAFSFTISALAAGVLAGVARGQSYGVELHNTLMPASGGMGGASIARPQDLVSAVNANPATLTQFQGTQFMFGGAWGLPDFNLAHTGNNVVPGVTPFAEESGMPGTALGNIGFSQSLEPMGLPVTIGGGLISNAGAGVDFRGVPASNGTSSSLVVLQFTGGAGVQLTERLSAGATISAGQGFYDGPFVGLGASTLAYGIRGAAGLNYQLTERTSLGAYYQTKESFVFEDAISLQLANGQFETVRDIRMDLPDNIGFGVANNSLMGGCLLLSADAIYKNWDNCHLYQDIYRNQWVMQLGSQYSYGKYRLRAGYAYAQNPLQVIDSVSIDGFPLPGAVPSANYVQAQLAVINPHRISFGVGVADVMPGVNFDLFAGFMLRESQDLGPFTSVALSSYYAGAGLPWRFGAGR